ncbi:MAG: hypothetical protein MJZ98_00895 [Paludibacteraceae bacterium]|nr:hypothetical protein [Paludibacteraceae bacterium]
MNLYRLLSRSLQSSIVLTLAAGALIMWPVIAGNDTAMVQFMLQGQMLFALPDWVARALQFAVIMLIGISAQRLTESSFLAPVRTYAFYNTLMLFTLATPEMHVFTENTLIALLFYISVHQLIKILIYGHAASKVVNITFVVMAATCIKPASIIMLPVFFIALIGMRQMNLRNFTALFLTLACCSSLIAAAFYLLNQMPVWENMMPKFHLLSLDLLTESPQDFVYLAIVLVMTLVIIVLNQIYMLRYKIQVRTLQRVLAFISLICWVMLCFMTPHITELTTVVLLFSAFLLGPFFSNQENNLARVFLPLLFLFSVAKLVIEYLGIF